MGKISTSLTPQQVDDLVAGEKVVVFSKSYCPYCINTKKLLAGKGIDFALVELDEIPGGSDVQAYLAKKTGQRTVPNIFIAQKHIGGNSDLVALNNSGHL
ncbi:MAG: hypothetical protein SGCHY_005634, partial [Lobulomycetales sp.]